MADLGWGACARLATPEDDTFLYDVFCTTWQAEVAAMPDPRLVQHFLRIQYTAQNERFHQRYPGHERWVLTRGDKRAGRLFLHRSPGLLHVLEMTLLPEFRSLGLGTALLRSLLDEAAETDRSVALRVARRNVRAANLYNSIGFRLVTMDDQDSYFEWTPQVAQLS